MTTKSASKAPKHLSAEARAVWTAVDDAWQLDPAAETVLTAGMEAFDRMREAQAAIKKDGAYLTGRWGVRAHPALSIERDSRIAMMRAFRQLDLPAPDLATPHWRR